MFKYFKNIENVISDDPYSEYLIFATNVNLDDPLIWKYCFHEHNFLPVWSDEYGNCNIKRDRLEEAMKYADDWIDASRTKSNKDKTFLYLMKVHTIEEWQKSKKLITNNEKSGIFE